MSAVPNLGGYDYNFVAEVPDKLKCAICLLVLKDPLQFTKCGHRFCKLCIQPILNAGPAAWTLGAECPKDRLWTTKKEVFNDTACKREVMDLRVWCPIKRCRWTGELRDVKRHRTTCLFEMVKCLNTSCDMHVLRRDITKHQEEECPWRSVRCSYCEESYVYNNAKIHNNECRRYPISCPNKCGICRTAREEMKRHVKTDCPRTIVPCTHEDVGCTAKCRRSALRAHERENVQMHLRLACAELKAVRNQVANVVHGPTSTKFIWKISDYNEKLQAAKSGTTECLLSEPFYTAPPGYKIRVQLFPNGGDDEARNNDVSVFLQIKKGEYDEILPWPFQCKTTITVFDQEKDQEKRKNVVQPLNPILAWGPILSRPAIDVDNGSFGVPFLISQDKLKKSFIASDTIFLQVEIEKPPPSRKRQRSRSRSSSSSSSSSSRSRSP